MTRHHRRHPAAKPTNETFAEAADACRRLRGCTCAEVELTRQHVGGNLYLLDVRHDPGCPAIEVTR